METHEIEYRISELTKLYARRPFVNSNDQREFNALHNLLREDFEELGAAVIYSEDYIMRRHYVNLMRRILKVLTNS